MYGLFCARNNLLVRYAVVGGYSRVDCPLVCRCGPSELGALDSTLSQIMLR